LLIEDVHKPEACFLFCNSIFAKFRQEQEADFLLVQMYKHK